MHNSRLTSIRYGMLAASLLALSACASTGVSMFPGENGKPTGAVAVLDPETGEDVSVLDQADSKSSVSKRHVSMNKMKAGMLEARYGDLLASMPEPPRLFVLYFKENSTELVDESGALLPELFAEVERRPGVDLQIIGHTDTVGDEGLNDQLSVKRAEEVKTLLAGMGLNGQVIRAAGRGERELLQPTPDETENSFNRRVEVLVR